MGETRNAVLGDVQGMEKIYEVLGWQGGTIHQIVEEIERLKKCEELVKEALEDPIMDCADGWRETSKILPDKDGMYLIYINYGMDWQRIRATTYLTVDGNFGGWKIDEITHWRPLPFPPTVS